ncbi:hypothetical protein ONE63_006458 [Megalurothrips usitatus]|uniref:Uncharacterized protein n=1 Tax=Megalurothrips usitatus TaxID=439358 RepID=A0AAV7Y0U8_9NEOP|nr:hypothetical protein ONE63_006458 [Megalurothrips usitatus]
MVSASHYRDLLQQECAAIGGLCDQWQAILNDRDAAAIPDDVCGKIQIAVGQAQLLMKKKFEQFRGLIAASENGELERRVTVEDLQGFWELVYIQVSDIHSKFQEVQKLKENNWEPASMQENLRRPLGNLNKSTAPRQKSLVVNKDFTAQARQRLAQAKALARKRMEEQVCQ